MLYGVSAAAWGRRKPVVPWAYSSRLRGTKRSSSLTGGSRMLFSDDLAVAGVRFSLKVVAVVIVADVVVGLMN